MQDAGLVFVLTLPRNARPALPMCDCENNNFSIFEISCFSLVILRQVFYVHRLSDYKPPRYFEMRFPGEYEALAWIIGCTGLLQIPIGATACLLENIRVRRSKLPVMLPSI